MKIYDSLDFPNAGTARPFVLLNMVATIDGKILSGERSENVMDLGSETDHATMRAIEAACDAVMIGAGSLRATKGLWYDNRLIRVVVTGSGELDYSVRFFQDAKERAIVVTSPQGAELVPDGLRKIVVAPPIVFHQVLRALRNDFGVSRLLIEGGSELNASLFKEDLIDEVFLTVAPKIKLGREVPTIADGDPLQRDSLLDFEIVSQKVVESEVFLRYRRRRESRVAD